MCLIEIQNMALYTFEERKQSVLIQICGGSCNLHVNVLNTVDLNIKINSEKQTTKQKTANLGFNSHVSASFYFLHFQQFI